MTSNSVQVWVRASQEVEFDLPVFSNRPRVFYAWLAPVFLMRCRVRAAGLDITAVAWGLNFVAALTQHQPTHLASSPPELL